MKFVEKNAMFMTDEEGVIIVTDIKPDSKVECAEFIYDGKNTAVLNRNNECCYVFKNISPIIREKIKQGEYVTIMEQDEHNKQAYETVVHITDFGLDDDWHLYAKEVLGLLHSKLSPQEYLSLMDAAEEMFANK